MRVFCTNCSASKDPAKGLVPAFKRYVSPRIARVHDMANRTGEQFCILSGEFGLVDWNQPLPWYDHLLVADEVPDLSQKIARQLAEKGITRVDYYTVSPKADPKVLPYMNTIEKACQFAGVELRGFILDEPKLSSTLRDWKQIMEWAAEARQVMIADRASGEAEFAKLLSNFPDDGMIFFERAGGYEALGELRLAKTDFERAKQLFPLERWQWEAQKALDRISEELAAGGTIAEARRRVNNLNKLDQQLRREAIAVLAKVGTEPVNAAAELRRSLEVVVNLLASKYRRRATGNLLDDIRNLQAHIPELVVNHMHTIRILGNRATHAPAPGEPPIQATDVYPAVTAFVAILEWWHSQQK